jgi:transposase
MVMDRASWHTGGKAKKRENIAPLFQPPKSPELNPVEHLWHHVREKGNFKKSKNVGNRQKRQISTFKKIKKRQKIAQNDKFRHFLKFLKGVPFEKFEKISKF